jgi:hypothetical protein
VVCHEDQKRHSTQPWSPPVSPIPLLYSNQYYAVPSPLPHLTLSRSVAFSWCMSSDACYHEAIGILMQTLTLWLGKVPKHCFHNSSTKKINPPLEKTNYKIMCEGTFTLPYQWKQCCPPVIPTIDCTPADLWCRTAWDNQLTEMKQGSACLVWNSQQ